MESDHLYAFLLCSRVSSCPHMCPLPPVPVLLSCIFLCPHVSSCAHMCLPVLTCILLCSRVFSCSYMCPPVLKSVSSCSQRESAKGDPLTSLFVFECVRLGDLWLVGRSCFLDLEGSRCQVTIFKTFESGNFQNGRIHVGTAGWAVRLGPPELWGHDAPSRVLGCAGSVIG